MSLDGRDGVIHRHARVLAVGQDAYIYHPTNLNIVSRLSMRGSVSDPGLLLALGGGGFLPLGDDGLLVEWQQGVGVFIHAQVATYGEAGGFVAYRAGLPEVGMFTAPFTLHLPQRSTGGLLTDHVVVDVTNAPGPIVWQDAATAYIATVGSGLDLSGGILSATGGTYTDTDARNAVGGIFTAGQLLYTPGTPAMGLATTGVGAGTYGRATVTVDIYGRITAISANAAYTDADAVTAVAANLTDTTTIAWTFPGGLAIEADVVDDSIANGKLSEVPAWTFKCRNIGTTGNPQDQGISDFTTEAAPASGDFAVGFSAAGLLRKFDLGNLPTGGTLVQATYDAYTSNTALGTAIPVDDTIPQNTEGTQILSRAFTPTNAANLIRIRFRCFYGLSAATASGSAALFVDSTAGALTACAGNLEGSYDTGNLLFEHQETAGSTSARTYKVRVGPSSGNMYVNGNGAGTRYFGGVAKATLIIEEIKV